MRRLTLGVAVTLGMLGLAVAGMPVTASASPQARPAQQRYIVQTESVTTATAAAVDVRNTGGRIGSVYAKVFPGFSATMTAEQVRSLRKDQRIESVTADTVFHSTDVQTNPTWGLDRIDQRSETGSKSYSYDTTGAGVTAYVVDTGIRLSHTQFAGRARSGYDFVDYDDNAADCDGHGTHVSGTIGGSTYGAAKGVKLVAVRVLNCEGSGWASDIIDGLDWVVAHRSGPSVVNLSIGGGASDLLDQAVERTVAAGVPVVVAAGNDGDSACDHSPARAPHAITVAATDSTDSRPSWSNYGRCVDLFAPGVDVKSASNASDKASELMSGTSMATPHVAGLIARYLQAHPKATPAQATAALVAAATLNVVQDPDGSPNRLLYAAPPAGRSWLPSQVTSRRSANG